jgi:hypothetical protein
MVLWAVHLCICVYAMLAECTVKSACHVEVTSIV